MHTRERIQFAVRTLHNRNAALHLHVLMMTAQQEMINCNARTGIAGGYFCQGHTSEKHHFRCYMREQRDPSRGKQGDVQQSTENK